MMCVNFKGKKCWFENKGKDVYITPKSYEIKNRVMQEYTKHMWNPKTLSKIKKGNVILLRENDATALLCISVLPFQSLIFFRAF